MNIEEKFNTDTVFVLGELKADLLVSENNIVSYHFIEEDGAPLVREQKRILHWMMSLGAVSLIDRIHQSLPFGILNSSFFNAPTVGYQLKVESPIFQEFSKIYEGDVKTDPATIIAKAKKLKKVTKVTPSKVDKQVTAPVFSAEHKEIYFNGKTCAIPVGNQLEVAKKVFSVPLGTWVNETDVVDSFSNGDNKQSFYDAQRQLNMRIKKDLGLVDLVQYQTAMVRINPAVIEKLNHSVS